MSCDHPNIGIFYPYRDSNGKRILKRMISYDKVTDQAIDDYYHEFVDVFSDKDDTDPKIVKLNGSYYEALLLPCGHCIGCRLEYSRQWAMRCTLEALQHECNYFITLTYDDVGFRYDWKHGFHDFIDQKNKSGQIVFDDDLEPFKKYVTDPKSGLKVPNLPTNEFKIGFDPETGVILHEGHSHPLNPDDLTKFIKDLRKYYSVHLQHDGIRFFACGEYGGKTGRPHFHIILFNCPIPDLKLYKTNFQDKPLYNSPIIDRIWKKGYAVIAECNFDTCAYVARYIMKKQTGQNKVMYDIMDLTPEFTRMSRMPGIGRQYYDQNTGKIYSGDCVTFVGANGKTLQPCPPKYFDALYCGEDPEDFERIKNNRLVKMALAERSREYETGLKKSTHIKMVSEQRDRVLIALKRTN